MDPKASYGILERSASGNEADQHAERIRLTGYTVVRDAFTAARLAEIGEEETARCCMAVDEAFIPVLSHRRVMEICRRLLGDFFILTQQNGIVNPPGRSHTQRAYHRDLAYQHLVSSRPLAVSALLCVDAFTVDNGATVVLPGSHKLEEFPSQETADALQVPLEASAG